MSASPVSVTPIFATPFGLTQLDEAQRLNALAAPVLTARVAGDNSAMAAPHPLCQRSRDDLLESAEGPVRELCGGIVRAIWSMAASVNGFSAGQLSALTMQARAWCTVVSQNGAVAAASYPLTSWCAIYCLEAPAPSEIRQDSGVLRLYESRLGTMFSDATNATPVIPYTPGHYTWRPVPGQMAIFPAWIRHEVALIRSPGRLMLVTVRARFVAPGQEGVSRW